MFVRFGIILFVTTFFSVKVFSQGCCSGGSGSPIAGGVSQGVLQEGQIEIAANYQYFGSDKFYTGSKDTSSQSVNGLQTHYLYSRFAYGITTKFTLSIEAGYFFNKTETSFNSEAPDYKKTSSGFSDLIIFPRYDVYDKTDEKYHTEITLGMGMKIPVGKYDDKYVTSINPFTGSKNYSISPPTVQPTTGSNDFIFYGFALREFKKAKFKLFANTLYMRKGYNPLGEKFGDYASLGLFANKLFFRKLGVTFQLKYEWIGQMQTAAGIDAQALYNVDINSTGSKKLSFVPQVNYNFKSFTVYGLYDQPLYQYLNGFQIGSQYLVTLGISYRFMPGKSLWKSIKKES